MARPLDWGDIHPSDLDDTPPSNPTAGFEEIDYQTAPISGAKGIRGKNPRKETPDLQRPFIKTIPRSNFAGLVVAADDEKQTYSILRHDGFVGFAKTTSDDRRYQAFEIGDMVSIAQSDTPDTYYFSGLSKPLEYSSISAYSSQAYGPFNTEMELFFGETTELTGEDLELNDNGLIAVLRDLYGLYEIHYTVIAECYDVDLDPSHTDSAIKVINKCSDGDTEGEYPEILSNKIDFDRLSGLKVTGGDCASNVTIQIKETDYMPYSPSGGGVIKWTNEPRCASAIKVGTMVGQGWVKIESNGAGKLWLGHGNTECKVLFPSNAPSLSSFLYVAGIFGTAVKLNWTPQPGCGNISVNDYDGSKTWVVKNGLIISGPGIQPCGENIQFVAAEPEKKDWACGHS